jgi:hypothetical protein
MRMEKLALIAAAFALAGCPTRAPPPDLSLDPAELLAQVRTAQERVTSVRGEVRLRIETEEFSGTVHALVAAQKPDRLLVHVLDFFGNTASALASADGALSLYDARERVLYRGPATPENLARLVSLPLAPAELAEILCGSAPLLRGVPVRADPGRGFVDLELAAGASTQVLRIGPGAAVLRSWMWAARPGAAGTYDLAFDELHAVPGRYFPAEIALSAEDPRVRLRLAWLDAEPNAALGAELFAPRVPRGARVVDLAEAASAPGLFPRDLLREE